MNIIIAINKKYIERAKSMLFSLRKNNDCDITVYLLHKELSPMDIAELSFYLKNRCNMVLKTVLVDSTLFQKAPLYKWWSEEMYYRLLAFDFIPTAERALWLDSDIIINGNIENFYNQPMSDKFAVVCEGCNQTGNSRLGLPENNKYFNSGVILFNFNEIRKSITVQHTFDIINKYKDVLKMPDQDILNIMYYNNVIYANPNLYNNETFGDHIIPKQKMTEIKKIAKIIHYNGPIKPWDYKGINWADSIFWKYEIKRGKFIDYLIYRFKNFPVKTKAVIREIYFMIRVIKTRLTREVQNNENHRNDTCKK